MKSKALHIALAIPQLVLYGLLCIPVIVLVSVAAALGVVGLFFLVGFLILAVLGLVLYGMARIEEARAGWTFDLEVPEHRLRTSDRVDGWRIPHTLLLQYADSRTWTSLLHGFLTSLLGFAALFGVYALGHGIAWLVAPFVSETFAISTFWLVPGTVELGSWLVLVLGILLVVVSAAALIGLAYAHRAISASLLVPSLEAELRREAREQSTHRQQAISAADIERTRIERDLHDGVQPRLVAVGMTLGMARRKLENDPARAGELIEEARESTMTAVTELRQLVRGFQPAVLQDRGLDAALSALIGRSHTPVDIRVSLSRRHSDRAEATMYFAVAESLTNATKHSGANRIFVRIDERLDAAGTPVLYAYIEDDGRGGAHRDAGGGIDGVINRVTAVGGTYRFSSPQGGPTVIEVTVPCAS
ncbi:histidine kinase [Gulosibacter sp. 10]|uniref:sensor histidine kinase n=1 Tax=Gulosibacter sp. 10 TaxID=1255570 RepID=UPI00097F0353|nr:histidine kinase [Gulosibacter sp. 10]SJM61976.1 two-component system sensor kinase [Gulosibacter sp. 10]